MRNVFGAAAFRIGMLPDTTVWRKVAPVLTAPATAADNAPS
jgi:hypothetical protein